MVLYHYIMVLFGLENAQSANYRDPVSSFSRHIKTSPAYELQYFE